jgi:peptide chain release factor 2
MLLRMFARWAERRSFDVDVDEVHYGEEAGIKSATFTVRGHNATSCCRPNAASTGSRIGPFDAEAAPHVVRIARRDPALTRPRPRRLKSTRQTSGWTSTGRVDGGQGVNTTDSAHITHLPTGSSSRVRTSARSCRTGDRDEHP